MSGPGRLLLLPGPNCPTRAPPPHRAPCSAPSAEQLWGRGGAGREHLTQPEPSKLRKPLPEAGAPGAHWLLMQAASSWPQTLTDGGAGPPPQPIPTGPCTLGRSCTEGVPASLCEEEAARRPGSAPSLGEFVSAGRGLLEQPALWSGVSAGRCLGRPALRPFQGAQLARTCTPSSGREAGRGHRAEWPPSALVEPSRVGGGTQTRWAF